MANYNNNSRYNAGGQNYGGQQTYAGYQGQSNGYQQQNGYQAQGGYQNQQGAQTQNQNSGNRRYYSYFDGINAVDNQGRPCVFAVMEGSVANVQQARTTQAGKVVNFSIGLDNRSEFIQRLTGVMPDTDQNGRTWVRVSVWNQAADRFEKYRAAHSNSVIVATGLLSMDQYTDRDGRPRVSPNLMLRSFTHIRDLQARNNQNSGNRAQNQANNANAAPAPVPAPAMNNAGGNPFPAYPGTGAPAPAPVNPVPAQAASADDMPPFYDPNENPFSMDNMAGMDAGFQVN